MSIREEAWPFAAPPLVLAAVLTVTAHYWLMLPFWAVGLFVLAFFRDPHRTPPGDETLIVSAADGRVCQIADLDGKKRVSVFMSVFNVHVNRSPVEGKIVGMEYNPGRFMNAAKEKASLDNEQLRYTLETMRGPVTVVQIAGLVARRIVPFVVQGAVMERGQRLGLIRFGSRVDFYLPPSRAEVLVSVGDRVKAGETPLARWKESP